MQRLTELEGLLERLVRQYRDLRAHHHELLEERTRWQEERSCLVAEIDRILQRLDDVPDGEQ